MGSVLALPSVADSDDRPQNSHGTFVEDWSMTVTCHLVLVIGSDPRAVSDLVQLPGLLRLHSRGRGQENTILDGERVAWSCEHG
jgi:hypothetical protein